MAFIDLLEFFLDFFPKSTINCSDEPMSRLIDVRKECLCEGDKGSDASIDKKLLLVPAESRALRRILKFEKTYIRR